MLNMLNKTSNQMMEELRDEMMDELRVQELGRMMEQLLNYLSRRLDLRNYQNYSIPPLFDRCGNLQ